MNIFQLDSSRNSTVSKKDSCLSSLNYYLRKKEITSKGIRYTYILGMVK